MRLALALCLAAPSAVAAPPAMVPPAERADFVYLDKSERRLELRRGGEVLKTYRVALGFAPEGDKRREGDGKTPEGRYLLDWRNPQSRFHLSLHVSYPDARDREEARAAGVPPGGDIFIHGASRPGAGDWTLGCIAVTDAEMEEIWAMVPNGTIIEIEP